MPIDPNNIPERMRKCMAPETRKAIGPAAMTMDDAEQKRATRVEKAMHDRFIQWLNLNGIPFVHSRMDKPSTIKMGFPDFTLLMNGRGVCVEFKAPGGKLKEEQADCLAKLHLAGVPVRVFEDVGAAIHFAKENLAV